MQAASAVLGKEQRRLVQGTYRLGREILQQANYRVPFGDGGRADSANLLERIIGKHFVQRSLRFCREDQQRAVVDRGRPRSKKAYRTFAEEAAKVLAVCWTVFIAQLGGVLGVRVFNSKNSHAYSIFLPA